MANTNEIVMTKAAEEVTKEVVKNGVTLKVIAKHGLKAAVGLAAAYGLLCGAKKVTSLFKKPKKVANSTDQEVYDDDDPLAFVPDELPPIDGE